MRPISFTDEDRRSLAHDRFHRPDPRVRREMEVLWLKSHGLGHDDIATLADVSRRTVQRSLDEDREGGRPGLRCVRWHRPRAALAGHRGSLEEYFAKDPARSAKRAQAVIERKTGVRRGLGQVRHFLKESLGLRWRQTGAIPVPPGKTIQEPAQERAAFPEEKPEPRPKRAREGHRRVDFVDAAHFVFAPSPGSLWRVARLFARAASGRKRRNVPGAFGAVTRRLIRVTNPGSINADSVRTPPRSVAGAAVGPPITMVLDEARSQKRAPVRALAESLGIESLYLPSYSPNLQGDCAMMGNL